MLICICLFGILGFSENDDIIHTWIRSVSGLEKEKVMKAKSYKLFPDQQPEDNNDIDNFEIDTTEYFENSVNMEINEDNNNMEFISTAISNEIESFKNNNDEISRKRLNNENINSLKNEDILSPGITQINDNTENEKKNHNFTIHSSSLLSSNNTNQSNSIKQAKFNISHVSSDIVDSNGGEFINVTISTIIQNLFFCRFNDIIVTGFRLTDIVGQCRVPALYNGTIKLCVSLDRKKWSSPLLISSIDPNQKSRKMIYVFILAVFIILLSLLARFLWVKGNRRRKLNQMKNRRLSPLVNVLNTPSTDEINLHRRNVTYQI